MRWTIHPLVGVGPLRFGMSRDEVASAAPELGPVERALPTWDGTGLNEHRALHEPTCGYGDKGLDSIGFDWRARDLLFDGTDLFATEPAIVVRQLHVANGDAALIGLGSLLFRQLGVAIGGFYSEELGRYLSPKAGDEEYRTVALEPFGASDPLLESYKPFRLAD